MRALVGAALAVALAVPSVGPPPRSTPVADDYPLRPGMRWTYRAVGLPASVVRQTVGLRAIEGREYVDMKFVLPVKGTYVWPMRRTRAGVVTRHDGREHLLMKFPMRAGDAWRIDIAGLPGLNEVQECEVVGPEETAFLGGRRPATKLRVTRVDRRSGRRTVDYEWHAAGYGLVRMEVTYGLRATFVLERFEPVVP